MAKKGKRKAAPGDVATNRQASFRYHLSDHVEAGIQLQGSEVKSMRDGGVQIKDAFAFVRKNKVFLVNMHSRCRPGGPRGHEPERERKLLLHRYEIDRLIGSVQEKGLTLVPPGLLQDGRAKVGRAGPGEDQGDKRRDLKAKDQRREIDRPSPNAENATRGQSPCCVYPLARPGVRVSNRPRGGGEALSACSFPGCCSGCSACPPRCRAVRGAHRRARRPLRARQRLLLAAIERGRPGRGQVRSPGFGASSPQVGESGPSTSRRPH